MKKKEKQALALLTMEIQLPYAVVNKAQSSSALGRIDIVLSSFLRIAIAAEP